jgi:hypothetical protein
MFLLALPNQTCHDGEEGINTIFDIRVYEFKPGGPNVF